MVVSIDVDSVGDGDVLSVVGGLLSRWRVVMPIVRPKVRGAGGD